MSLTPFHQTDSLRLWQAICSNKILADVEFVLFLNKLDILDSKLKSGVKFSSFVTSYTDQANETKPVAKCTEAGLNYIPLADFYRFFADLLDVFVSLHQQYSPKKRKLHPHLTCAVVRECSYFHHHLLIFCFELKYRIRKLLLLLFIEVRPSLIFIRLHR